MQEGYIELREQRFVTNLYNLVKLSKKKAIYKSWKLWLSKRVTSAIKTVKKELGQTQSNIDDIARSRGI